MRVARIRSTSMGPDAVNSEDSCATQRDYWQFYWPLSLMGVAILGGRLAQNYVLLDYEAGVEELAVYALALGVFNPFRATLGFIPQMANVLVHGPRSLWASLQFVVLISMLFTAPLLVVAWTPLGQRVLPLVYDVGEVRIGRIMLYLRYLAPLVLVGGLSQFLLGLLVQTRRTKMVTGLRVLNLALMVGVLAVGIQRGWDPVLTICASIVLPLLAHTVLSGALVLAFRGELKAGHDRRIPQREIAAYFLPMVGTNVLFTLTRPIIFAFITQLDPQSTPGLPSVDTMVAAVALAAC